MINEIKSIINNENNPYHIKELVTNCDCGTNPNLEENEDDTVCG